MWNHRSAPTELARPRAREAGFVDHSVLVLALIVGGARVALGFWHHEVFGAEATVALVATFFAAAALLSAGRNNSIR